MFSFWTNPPAALIPGPRCGSSELIRELTRAGKTIITATHNLDIVEKISTRAIVIGEDHTIKGDRDCTSIMNDLKLLMSANLIHTHIHQHGRLMHKHLHALSKEHEHGHELDGV